MSVAFFVNTRLPRAFILYLFPGLPVALPAGLFFDLIRQRHAIELRSASKRLESIARYIGLRLHIATKPFANWLQLF